MSDSIKSAKLIRPVKSPKIIHSSTVASIGPDGGLDIRPVSDAISPEVSHDDRREVSGPRGSSPQGGVSTVNSQLPIDSGNSAIEGAKTSSRESSQSGIEESPAIILQGLMDKFISLKETGGKAEAFKALQKSFASNAAVLSPYFIPLKDLMNLIMELETFIGKSSEYKGKTPEQVIRGFLQSNVVEGI